MGEQGCATARSIFFGFNEDWRLRDVQVPGTPADNIENGCGLTDRTGRRKPAWETLRRLRAAAP